VIVCDSIRIDRRIKSRDNYRFSRLVEGGIWRSWLTLETAQHMVAVVRNGSPVAGAAAGKITDKNPARKSFPFNSTTFLNLTSAMEPRLSFWLCETGLQYGYPHNTFCPPKLVALHE